MTRITRITRSSVAALAALAALALVAPVASAIPSRDVVGTSSLAGTTSPQQDRRGPDARAASATPQTGAATPGKDLRSADARDAGTKAIKPPPGLPTSPIDPEPIAPAPVNAAPVGDGDDTSPLVYILPGAIVSLLLAAGVGHAVRSSGRVRRTRIGA